MTGRRERKKRAVRTAVVAAAAEMFARDGFESTRIEAIAQAADIAVGTVYNHFPAKSDILLAVLTRDAEEVLAAAASRESAYGLASSILDAMEKRPRHLWRQLYAQALLDGERLGPAFSYVLAQFEALLSEVLPEGSAAVAFGIGFSAIYRYVMDDGIDVRRAKEAIRRQFTDAGVERV